MNEAETRAEYIDPALKAAGWGVVEGAEFGVNTPSLLGVSKATASVVRL